MHYDWMIHRRLSDLILKDSRAYPVVGIIGPRQSGKTTLARHLFPHMTYANLENLNHRDFAERDPVGFLAQSAHGMVIDEFQRMPKLLSHIQARVDETNSAGQYVLTGSQNYLMMEQISQSLAGRISLFTLYPLALSELSGFGASIGSLESLLFTGLFPRLYNVEGMDPYRYYQNYVTTYVERDVRQIKNVTDITAFQGFLKLCAGRTGQLVNYSSIADDLGISHNTAKSWMSVLETSFVLLRLPPYYRNFRKQIAKSPKIYFCDTGLLCSLLRIDTIEKYAGHYLKGGIFENFVVAELLKARLNAGRVPNLFYWRDKTGREVDLLFDDQARRVIAEIKAGQSISGSMLRNLDYYGALDSGSAPQDRYLIYGGDEEQDRSNARIRSWRSLCTPLKSFGIG